MAPRLDGRLVATLACVLVLAACGDAERPSGATDCGDGVKPCACGDTVVADFRLTADIVCTTSRGDCDVERFACTGLALASGVTLDGAGFALVGPAVPAADGAVPDARRDALYGVVFPPATYGARVQDLEVRGFARGVVFRNGLRECTSDAECGTSACAAAPAELAGVVLDPTRRWCAGNVAAGLAVRHDASAFGEQLGLFGFSITAPDPEAVDDVGGMNVIDGGLVVGIGDRGLHVSQARLNVVRDLLIEGSSRENVHLLREADENLLVGVHSVRAGTGAPNVFVEDSKRNVFLADVLEGSFVHVVGASDGNRFVDSQLVGEGARYDFETDVEEATGSPRPPRDNLVLGGGVARSGSRSLPCVILDGASGTVFDSVALECGDAAPAPGETPVDVLVARDNPDPERPNVFHVGDCDPAVPDLLVARDEGVSEAPLVFEDRGCR
ncbi:MAG: hypothetical protein AB1689_24095 [Thermodesulfobacteriota bacterium]